MKNIKEEGEGEEGNVGENQMKKLMVLAAVGLKLARKIFEKVERVENSLEIMASEILRQSERDESHESEE